ncbi:2-phospho-L-lactate guanylyltransferase [Nitrolancea hollandica]|uniref:2-phospho-L-lactate guanylyltransferase CofC n=1 Tax=Nitrolancea hollandica Lb TaxID=1129897 RepID=I4EGC4_9BACT|nr:2-phospho-L-lactate guanylyltransferase [Nitrolancea hollandica]CCF83736.1 2-phospho-L-lactate guanylyltransferase CofC [Nitrolancea hollandica Lb]
MTVVAIVPVQHLAQAKSRLAGRLSPAERRALAVSLLDIVLGALRESTSIGRTIVVTPDPEVLDLAARNGAVGLREHGAGLNAAITQARDVAIRWGAGTLLVMLGDLPLVRPADVDDLLHAAKAADVVLAPDRHRRGTNALVLRPPDTLEPAFGPGSYPAHRAAANARGLRTLEFQSPAIAFDIDVAADLDKLERGGVPWMEPVAERFVAPDDRGCAGQNSYEAESRGGHRFSLD